MNDLTNEELQAIITSILTLHLKHGSETNSASALAKVKHELERRVEADSLDFGCDSCTL